MEQESQSLSPVDQIAQLFPEDEDIALVILKMLLADKLSEKV